MTRSLFAIGFLLCLLAGNASAQQVIIADFPLGVGGSIEGNQFTPYRAQLQSVADTLKAFPLARAVVTGGADGERFQRNHDALNPGLAVGRAHVLRNLLVKEFGVDSSQIIIQSEDSKIAGADRRFASVRVDRTLVDLENRLKAVEQRPPVERVVTEVQPVHSEQTTATGGLEFLGLELGVGGSSSPYGFMPMLTGAVTWKRVIFIEGIFGHTFWNGDFTFESQELTTKRRMIGIQAIAYPSPKLPIGIVGGWVRIEEISQHYYEYVKLSEGPMVGLRVTPLDFLSVTGVYNPSKHRLAGRDAANMDNDQFLVNAAVHVAFGGAR